MALVNTLAIRLEAITSGFSSAFDKAAGTVNQLAAKFDNLNKKTGEAKSRADELTRNFTQLDNITSSIGAAFDSVAAASAGAGEGLGQFGDVTDEVLNNARALEASIREFAGGLEEELAGIAGKAAPAAQGLFKIAEEAAALGPKGLPVIDKIIAKLEELNRVPGKSAGAFDVTITAIRKLRIEAEAVGKPVSTLTKFTNAFIGTVRQGESAVAAFARENRTLGQVFKNTTQFVSSLNPVAAVSVAVIGLLGTALVRAVKHAIAFADVIAGVSKQTGFTTEFLSQMKFVVEQNGSSFDEAQTALTAFNRNLGEATQGSAAAIKAFERLGVAEDEIRKLSPEQVLSRVQESLKGAENAAVRTARGLAVFGRGSANFVSVMAQGTEAIEAQRLEADRLGHTISGNLARAADDFGDNLGKLRTLGTGLAIQLAEKVVPAFNDLLVTVIPLAARAIPLLAGSLSGLAFALSKVEALATLASVALLKFQNIGKGKLPAGVIISGFTENAAADAAQLEFLEQEAKRAKEQLFQTKEAFDAASKAALANVPVTKAAGEGFDELASTSAADALLNIGDEIDNTNRKLQELNALQEEALFRIESPERPTAESRIIPGVAPPLETQPVPELDTGFDDLGEKGIAFTDILGNIRVIGESTFQTLSNFAGGFGKALADVFSAANKKAFIDFFKALRDQIIAAIAKALILKAVLSFLPGGGIFGGLGKILSGKPLETPGIDAFAQSEGARFGLLFGRGLRSTFGQTAFAGISANPGTAQVVIEPQIVVQNAGPLARVEWFEKGQEQRLRRRQEELGGAPL